MGNKKKSVNKAPCSKGSGRATKTKEIPVVPDRAQLIYTSDDLIELSKNKYFRFHPNAPYISHAIIPHDGSTPQEAFQFEMPDVEAKDDTPGWKSLKNITPIMRYGRQVYQAQTLDDNTVYAARSYRFKDEDDNEFTLLPFSPPPRRRKEPFWGSTHPKPLYSKEGEKYVNKHFKEYNDHPVILGGRELEIDPQSVPVRQAVTYRVPSQKKVMDNQSGKEILQFWYDELYDIFSPEVRKNIETALAAKHKRDPLKPDEPANTKKYPELLHAEGYSLTPMSMNPQRKDNLGVAQAWVNTTMMILEDVVKWYSLHCPETLCTILPEFRLLLHTPIINQVDFQIRVGFKDRFLRFMQHIEALCLEYPQKIKTSDMAQIVKISQAMLTNETPRMVPITSLEDSDQSTSDKGNTAEKTTTKMDRSRTSPQTESAKRKQDTKSSPLSRKGMFSQPAHSYNLRPRSGNQTRNPGAGLR